jgi:hypothetical protein
MLAWRTEVAGADVNSSRIFANSDFGGFPMSGCAN